MQCALESPCRVQEWPWQGHRQADLSSGFSVPWREARHGAHGRLEPSPAFLPKTRTGACIMFGVRIVIFAFALLGLSAAVPFDLAEAKPSKASYAEYSRKSYAKHHWRKPIARPHTRKSSAKHHRRKSVAGDRARRSYSLVPLAGPARFTSRVRPKREWAWDRVRRGGARGGCGHNWAAVPSSILRAIGRDGGGRPPREWGPWWCGRTMWGSSRAAPATGNGSSNRAMTAAGCASVPARSPAPFSASPVSRQPCAGRVVAIPPRAVFSR